MEMEDGTKCINVSASNKSSGEAEILSSSCRSKFSSIAWVEHGAELYSQINKRTRDCIIFSEQVIAIRALE